MRIVQYRIQNLLNAVPIPSYIYAFERGRSIPTMAQVHTGQRAVISLDIKDFFHSIKQSQVEQVFAQLGMGEDVAKLVSELCTYKAFVPQGAITSPKISNIIIAGTFGPEVQQLCEEQGLALTIYADDITVSYPAEKTFESREEEREFHRSIISQISAAVRGYGFRINREKTKVMLYYTRQWVCGAVVNSRVNLQKKDRNRLRAIVHNCIKNGVESEALKSKTPTLDFIRKTVGKLNWMAQLNPDKGKPLYNSFRELVRPLVKMHPGFDLEIQTYSSGLENPDVLSGTMTQQQIADSTKAETIPF